MKEKKEIHGNEGNKKDMSTHMEEAKGRVAYSKRKLEMHRCDPT